MGRGWGPRGGALRGRETWVLGAGWPGQLLLGASVYRAQCAGLQAELLEFTISFCHHRDQLHRLGSSGWQWPGDLQRASGTGWPR